MYLVYCLTDGKIYREVDNYIQEENQIKAGLNGTYTLIYPNAINPAILEITTDQWNALDKNHLDKYKIVDGSIVEDSDWVNPDENSKFADLEQQVTDLQLALADVYETMIGGN